MSLDFLMTDSCTDVRHVLYTAPKRAYNPAKNSMQEALQVSAQVGVNTARKEAENLPKTGWPVDFVAQTCPCSYHFKYGDCVQERARVDSGAELALAGLSEDEVRAQVDTREVAAGNGPVHVLARVSELGLPVKRAASDDNATPAKRRKDIRDHMFFVRATQQLLKILKSNHNRVQTKFGGQWVMPLLGNVVGLGKTAFVHPETQG
ncbi:hypothetical protein PI126_g7951 [Phytophthora idaei]|nr:hypothetical protein PI126_g7951 [Phytophthora idaei]